MVFVLVPKRVFPKTTQGFFFGAPSPVTKSPELFVPAVSGLEYADTSGNGGIEKLHRSEEQRKGHQQKWPSNKFRLGGFFLV